MKKCLAVLLTVALLAVLCVPALAEGEPLVKVLMSTDGTSVSVPIQQENYPQTSDLDEAVENSDGIIPEDATFTPGRLTILGTGQISNDREVYDITFKVWSTVRRWIGLFFRAEGSDTWELVTCNLGDVIEGRFQTPGDYAIAVGW